MLKTNIIYSYIYGMHSINPMYGHFKNEYKKSFYGTIIGLDNSKQYCNNINSSTTLAAQFYTFQVFHCAQWVLLLRKNSTDCSLIYFHLLF